MQRLTFSALDGIRGIAALIVVFYHLETTQLKSSVIFPAGYLAVDLFFLMSGFVIAHAYEKKLHTGMGIADFMINRGVRLYPLYLLGTMFGLFVAISASLLANDSERLSEAFVSLPFALLAIPHLSADGMTWFPLAPPAWSLFYEVLLNLLYAIILHRLPNRVLFSIIAASLFSMAVLIAHSGNIGGIGALRCTFGISAGVLLYRKWVDGYLRLGRFPLYLPLSATIVATMLPTDGNWCLPTVMASLCIIFPLIVLIAAEYEPSRRSARAMKYLGALSYPIYLLHWPVILTVRKLASMINLSLIQQDLLTIFVTLGISSAALKFFDQPIRDLVASSRKNKVARA